MLNKFICMILSEMVQDNELNYCYNPNFFSLKDAETSYSGESSIAIFYNQDKTYSLSIKINNQTEFLDGVIDVQILYLLCVLKDNLEERIFSKALKEVLKKYKEMKEVIGEIENENSSN